MADLKKRFAGTQATRAAPTAVATADPAAAQRLAKEVELQVSFYTTLSVCATGAEVSRHTFCYTHIFEAKERNF